MNTTQKVLKMPESVEELKSLFDDPDIVAKIQKKLPLLFQLAEADNSRDGKIGMEIGSTRERIIIALLIYRFGEENIDANIPICNSETDVMVFGKPVSIKTTTGKKLGCVKLIWTVDPQKALEFSAKYTPSCDMILAQITWGEKGALYLLPQEVQQEVLDKIGRKNYIKLPKLNTNPRGVEISAEALNELANHKDIKKIDIDWDRQLIEYDCYDRWVEHWNED